MARHHIEALDAQVDLIRGFAPGQIGYGFADAFERSLRMEEQVLHVGAYRGAQWRDGRLFVPKATAISMPEWLAENLDRSDTYWIAPEMLDLVDHASPSMPDESFHLTDLPTPSGFAYLGRNCYTRDRHGRRIGFRAVAWWPGELPIMHDGNDQLEWKRGVEVAYFTDRDDYFDDINKELMTKPSRGWDETDDRDLVPPLSLVHLGFWPEDFRIEDVIEPWYWDEQDRKAAEERDANADVNEIERMMSWIKTFWRLLQQRVAKTTHHHPDRAALRRVKRLGIHIDTNDIRVVTLRRYREGVEVSDTGPTDEEGVFWSHRWIVDGHWRNQPYPSEGVHRQIWIAPYVKGPEDRPLIVKDKVYRWSR